MSRVLVLAKTLLQIVVPQHSTMRTVLWEGEPGGAKLRVRDTQVPQLAGKEVCRSFHLKRPFECKADSA